MQEAHVRALFKKLKPVMDKRLLWFAFYEDRPIAFFLMLPELNQVFKHVNGKLDLIGKLKFLWYRYVQRSPKMFGVIFGVIPDYQGKGLEGAIVVACKKVVVGAGYREMEMNWIGDFNPKMIHLLETLDSDLVKRHSTNRLYFDRSYPFEREKSIG
jgi:GNAT superfamily N-acetyltransferase